VHIYRFGIFALVVARDLSRSNRCSPSYYTKVALIAFTYGFLIEVYQIFLPHRGFEIKDLGWNGVGILAASGILWLFKRQRWKVRITNRKI
jgi:VanZ family protein